jgi:hypothetical protein
MRNIIKGGLDALSSKTPRTKDVPKQPIAKSAGIPASASAASPHGTSRKCRRC